MSQGYTLIENFLIKLFVAVQRGYKLCISPWLGENCRFHPTCSDYSVEAVKEFGLVKGSTMAFKRICKCHPFCEGGFDPVPINEAR
ncbi:MAG: membrane protein insertion efficiency factor YidD [Deltaproteobacteria bacterium]|nr:membrane protein insertion efficiency factor YidD [Deltaproteobacteria bacterium]